MRKLLFLILILSTTRLSAKEGMWLPMLVEQLNINDMRSLGFKLTAEEIYSVNNSSLKDAIVNFGGGCTAEIISDKGLLLTNHHCGYGQIQKHSSVENDYLRDGFWSMSNASELPNKGLTATLIVRMEDVTSQILEGHKENMTEAERKKIVEDNMKKIGDSAVVKSHYNYIIKPFYYGNYYYMFITETYEDVRLVGAPPSSIGKYGFDSDNWMWPRHTGDFSIFRIYADKNNKPAEYSLANVPYKPKRSLKMSLKQIQEGDFTLMYGFPGRTQEYLASQAVEYIMTKSNPAKINMRDESLAIINKAMASSDELRIKYAAKQSSISNSHKKWIGELNGLKRLDAINVKKEAENNFGEKLVGNKEWSEKYGHVLGKYDELYEEYNKYQFAREMFIEMLYYGPEVLRFALAYKRFVEIGLDKEKTESDLRKAAEMLKPRLNSFFKDYDKATDQQIFEKLMKMYADNMETSMKPEYAKLISEKYKNDYAKYTNKVYSNSVFVDRVNLSEILYNPSRGNAKKISKDPVFVLVNQLLDFYQSEIKINYTKLSNQIDELNRTYLDGLMTVLKEDKKYFPDANSTLRVGYGQVEGYEPKDGVEYNFYTTLDGVIEKYIPGDREYDLPQKLIDLYDAKDYGQYAYGDKMPVCFIASNHSTGGNSGSPVLDENGNLKGLNFDRCWEGTMSDIMFDPDRCRNIMVDVNYVLFIVDKYAGATRLIDEMVLVKE